MEIIEEIQGNGRLPRLQPSLFAQQGQAYFLPTVSEQEADAFSAEIKVKCFKAFQIRGNWNYSLIHANAE